jgi:glycosyltransferase involved in cell wall biosynthesis
MCRAHAQALRWEQLVACSTDPCPSKTAAVAVVLGFYNGHRFVGEQFQSIDRQTYAPVELFIADDGSPAPLDRNQIAALSSGRVAVHCATQSCNVGFNQNFLSALASVPDRFEYFAFSDQDDVWFDDKLERSIDWLQRGPADQPALYGARTAFTDSRGEQSLGLSTCFRQPPSFGHALVQNIAGGNTLVFNRAARDLICTAAARAPVMFYDWWIYQMIAGAQGQVLYDPRPCLYYRQHAGNVIGSNNRWHDRLTRVKGVLSGEYRGWIEGSIAALSASRDLLSPANQARLDQLIALRQAPLLERLRRLRATQIFRQPWHQNIALYIALALGKV